MGRRQTIGYHDFNIEIARGAVEGYSHVLKFGRNSSIASGATEEIWDGSASYVFPATALMTSISQTADQEAMRGASIRVEGLDANWDLVIQNATLGNPTTTVVTLDTALIRCFRMSVLANVAGDSAIRVHNAGETQDYAIITAGNNQTLMAIYTVPNGKTGYMTNWYAAINPATNQDPTSMPIETFTRDNDAGHEARLMHSVGVISGHIQHFHKPYMKVTQKTDIFMRASPVGKAADVSTGFDIILVDN